MASTNRTQLCANLINEDCVTEEYELPKCLTFLLIGLHIALFSFSIVGNICTMIISIDRIKTQAQSSGYFLAALAITELFLVLWCIPFSVISNIINFHWIFGEFMCSTVGYMQTVCVLMRAFILVASSLNRHRAIWRPIQGRNTTQRVTGLNISVAFILALLIPAPIAYFSKLVPAEEQNETFYCHEVWPSEESKNIFSILLMAFSYFLPLIILIVTFSHMAKIIRHKPPGDDILQTLYKRRASSERKMIKVFLLEFVVYAFCWFPIHVITIIGDVKPEIYNDVTVHIAWLFAHLIAMSNSAITPIVVLVLQRPSQARKRLGSQHIVAPELRNRRMTDSSWL
ncbi:hypothetical protein ACF0H5_001444 [Mactra antiquata]